MPVAQCSGTTPCARLISISQVPGGNPAAKGDPEGYASAWTLCACRAYTCDRCLGRQQGKCRCGAPARLFTEDERIQIARGGPLPAGGVAAPPHGPLSARAVPAGPVAPVRPTLEGIAMQIEFELGRNNLERARAMANLAANGMAQQGQNAPAEELPWIMRFGEGFYRWRFYAEGAQFWKGVFQLLKKHGHAVDSKESLTAIAANGAFQVLSGELTSAAPHAFSTVAMIERSFGPDHVLTREVKAKIGPLQPPTTPAAPQVPAAPAQPRPSPMAASYDAPTKLALWVTLAFLDVAMADGKTDDAEYLAWKNTMARMQLPDVWTRFGLQGLADMLRKGMLHELSVEFLGHPADARAKLAGTLVEFMLADGRIEPSEIEAVRRISGWLGVSIEIGGPAPGAASPPA